jgi:hypothetical protein
MWATSVIFRKLPKVNNRALEENSPNPVTLTEMCVCLYTQEGGGVVIRVFTVAVKMQKKFSFQ